MVRHSLFFASHPSAAIFSTTPPVPTAPQNLPEVGSLLVLETEKKEVVELTVLQFFSRKEESEVARCRILRVDGKLPRLGHEDVVVKRWHPDYAAFALEERDSLQHMHCAGTREHPVRFIRIKNMLLSLIASSDRP